MRNTEAIPGLLRDKPVAMPCPVKSQTGLLSYLSASPSLPSLLDERLA